MDGTHVANDFLPAWAKRIYAYLSTVPVGVEVDNYWFYSISNLAYTLITLLHISWVVVFYCIGQHTMMFVQFFSIACYLVAIYFNRRGYHILAATIAITEVNLHQVLAVVLLGWGTGFQNFIPLIALLPFLKYNEKWATKLAIGISCLLFYLFIDKFIKNTQPIYSLNQASFNFLNISNTFLCFLLVALWGIVLAISYQRAVSALLKKETEVFNLQKANEQAEILRQLDIKERDNEIFQLRYIDLRTKSDEILTQKAVIEELVQHQENIIRMRTRELEEVNSKLIEANKKLVELIQYNSHSLREPVTRLMGVMGLREDMNNEEFLHDFWPEMERAVNDLDTRIKSIVNNAEETYKLYR